MLPEIMWSRGVLDQLLRHMEWADARVWEAVPASDTPDPRLHELLTHIHLVQHAFFAIWHERSVDDVFQQGKACRTSSELRAFARDYYSKVHDYFASVGDERFQDIIVMPWAAQLTEFLGRPPSPTTLADTFFQVTSHSTYHRGQANARLRELGITPPLVDYIAWLWGGRPAPNWTA
jgi:uncharacterized damage-inducible protein DinB